MDDGSNTPPQEQESIRLASSEFEIRNPKSVKIRDSSPRLLQIAKFVFIRGGCSDITLPAASREA
jgi:hypothetical protein